jgi:hypothetical protein
MNNELAWLAMVDQLDAQPSTPMALAELAVSTVGKVVSIRTYNKGKLVNTQQLSANVIG